MFADIMNLCGSANWYTSSQMPYRFANARIYPDQLKDWLTMYGQAYGITNSLLDSEGTSQRLGIFEIRRSK
jgi:hypothetical protein